MSVIPALWEAEVGRSPEVGSSRPAWPTWRSPVSTKNNKISWVWRCMTIIPATWEAEAGEIAVSRDHATSLGNKSETPSQKIKNTIFIFYIFICIHMKNLLIYPQEVNSIISMWTPFANVNSWSYAGRKESSEPGLKRPEVPGQTPQTQHGVAVHSRRKRS